MIVERSITVDRWPTTHTRLCRTFPGSLKLLTVLTCSTCIDPYRRELSMASETTCSVLWIIADSLWHAEIPNSFVRAWGFSLGICNSPHGVPQDISTDPAVLMFSFVLWSDVSRLPSEPFLCAAEPVLAMLLLFHASVQAKRFFPLLLLSHHLRSGTQGQPTMFLSSLS